MQRAIVGNLRPKFEPVAVVWSDIIPGDAFQFIKGKFGCILYLFAEASRNGKIAGGNRDTITCIGGRAALGFGVEFDESDDQFDYYAALFSKGLKSARDQVVYRSRIEASRKSWRALLEYGDRRHCSAELAKK
jgi:hypothetical protein